MFGIQISLKTSRSRNTEREGTDKQKQPTPINKNIHFKDTIQANATWNKSNIGVLWAASCFD